MLQSIPVAFILHKGAKTPADFPIFAIGAMGIRFLTALVLLGIAFYLKVEDLTSFAIQFMVLYLCYLGFEMMVVLSKLRRN